MSIAELLKYSENLIDSERFFLYILYYLNELSLFYQLVLSLVMIVFIIEFTMNEKAVVMANRTIDEENVKIGRLLQDARESHGVLQSELCEST